MWREPHIGRCNWRGKDVGYWTTPVRSTPRRLFTSYEHIQQTTAVMIGESSSTASEDIHIAFCENIYTTPDRSTSKTFFTCYGHIQHTSAVMIGENTSAASDNIRIALCLGIRMTSDRSTSLLSPEIWTHSIYLYGDNWRNPECRF